MCFTYDLCYSSAGERRMWILKINRVVYTLNGTADSEEELGGNDNESTVCGITFREL